MKNEKLKIIQTLIMNAETNILQAKELLKQFLGGDSSTAESSFLLNQSSSQSTPFNEGKVIEGVFDEKVVDDDVFASSR